MIEGKRVLQTVGGHVTVSPESTDVVEQHVEPRVRREHLACQPVDLGLGRHVGDEDVHRRVARLTGDHRRGLLGPRAIAAGDTHAGTHRRKACRGGPADPTGPTGDQDGLAGHRSRDSHRELLARDGEMPDALGEDIGQGDGDRGRLGHADAGTWAPRGAAADVPSGPASTYAIIAKSPKLKIPSSSRTRNHVLLSS